MPISRELALLIAKYLLVNPTFYFPFLVVCKGYASDIFIKNDFVQMIPEDDYESLVENSHYDTFELWENLKNLYLQTIQLMSKGFIKKIISNPIETKILKNIEYFWNQQIKVFHEPQQSL